MNHSRAERDEKSLPVVGAEFPDDEGKGQAGDIDVVANGKGVKGLRLN